VADSLWGTFSVIDHLRPRPFVADVLLYDCLAIPVPNGDAEVQRWRSEERRPERQAELLTILGDLAVEVPWTSELVSRWREVSRRDGRIEEEETVMSADLAEDVAFDVKNIAAARKTHVTRLQSARHDPDDPAFAVTRMVLVDHLDKRRDSALVAGIPSAGSVKAVAAYASYKDFGNRRGRLVTHELEDAQSVYVFNWQFFVPATSGRSDDDLLRSAVELAHADEVGAWRSAIWAWQRDVMMKGTTETDALKDMKDLIAGYKKAAHRNKIKVVARWGLGVAAIAAGVAAVAFPPAGAISAACGIGSFIPSPKIPRRLEAGAMFYEAQKRLS
jgi:hypothetical protein